MLELLLMDNDVKNDICHLILHAEINPINYETMVKISKGEVTHPVLDSKDFEIELPNDIRVVYSIEEHPVGICKHISISQAKELPSIGDILLVLDCFSFHTKLDGESADHHYIEECIVDGKECQAINVIELLY